jgi:hypothetical protein
MRRNEKLRSGCFAFIPQIRNGAESGNGRPDSARVSRVGCGNRAETPTCAIYAGNTVESVTADGLLRDAFYSGAEFQADAGSARASSCQRSACPNGSSATLGDGLAEACQRSAPSYDDGAADGTAGLAGIKVRALVRGEAASSTSVPARSADNGPGIHNVKIAVVA